MKIPEKVTLFCRHPDKVVLLSGETKKVLPTYPAHEYSKARMTSGAKWGDTSYYGETKGLFRTDERTNLFHGLHFHRLDIRGEGGRAYKVAVGPDMYYIDLREDQLLDIMQNSSIVKGYIDDDFCFATVGSDFRIIRVNSEQYTELKKFDTFSKVKSDDLEFGSLCKGGVNDYYIYLGTVKSSVWEYKTQSINRSGYFRNETYEVPVNPVEWMDTGEKVSELWYKPYNFRNETLMEKDFKVDFKDITTYQLSFPKASKRTNLNKIATIFKKDTQITSTEEFLAAWNSIKLEPTMHSNIEYPQTDERRLRNATAYMKKAKK